MKDILIIGAFMCSSFLVGVITGINLYRDTAVPKMNYIKTADVQIKDTIHLHRATTYQPTTAQCDSNPLTTADGSKINPDSLQRWVALSRDMIKIWGGPFDYGDTIEFYSATKPHINGDWVLHDCMASGYKLSVDFLMSPEDNYPKLGIGTDVKIIICGDYIHKL